MVSSRYTVLHHQEPSFIESVLVVGAFRIVLANDARRRRTSSAGDWRRSGVGRSWFVHSPAQLSAAHQFSTAGRDSCPPGAAPCATRRSNTSPKRSEGRLTMHCRFARQPRSDIRSKLSNDNAVAVNSRTGAASGLVFNPAGIASCSPGLRFLRATLGCGLKCLQPFQGWRGRSVFAFPG